MLTRPAARPSLSRRRLRFAVRGAVLFAVSCSAGFGFLAGCTAEQANYDPNLFASGAATLFAVACVALAMLTLRNRLLRRKARRLMERVEELADRNWELREAEERNRRFLEAQGDVIVRRDGAGHITYANDAFCALAGRPRGALIGSDAALSVLEQRPITPLPDGARIHDQRIATADGPRWISWRDVMVRAQATETQSVGRDITDHVEAQQALADARDAAQAASRAKSRFLAMVSHEIRTPLNGMLGMTELLLDTPLSPEQMTYAKAAKASGDTLLSLIAEILDLAKIEAGKLVLEPRPFAPLALIEEVVELLSPRAQAKGLEIAGYVDPRLPPRLLGDAVRLRQVLLNLAGNAIKFTERGGGAVLVEPGEAGDVRFTVRDTGIGIAAEAQARIFGEFEQGDAEARSDGSGLGLAICRGLVERMGGTITVRSAPAEGATFTFAVPLTTTEAAAPAGPAADLRGRRILIVSPGPFEAGLLARRLRDWGAEPCVETEATRAGARMAAEPWDVLLVDFALGTREAASLAGAARTIERRIVLLPPAERPELASLTRVGFTGYLVQPVRTASLAARLKTDAADAMQLPAAAAAGPAGASLTVLVAEDNEINALLARALLGKLGHRPTVVADGAAAIEVWQAAHATMPYDLVLMDLHMPRLDGLAATRRIRALEAAGALPPVPIIALTANAFAEDHDACLAAGMSGFLTKPLERERLTDLIAALVKPPLAA